MRSVFLEHHHKNKNKKKDKQVNKKKERHNNNPVNNYIEPNTPSHRSQLPLLPSNKACWSCRSFSSATVLAKSTLLNFSWHLGWPGDDATKKSSFAILETHRVYFPSIPTIKVFNKGLVFADSPADMQCILRFHKPVAIVSSQDPLMRNIPQIHFCFIYIYIYIFHPNSQSTFQPGICYSPQKNF